MILHNNASTNLVQRQNIQNSELSQIELSEKYCISTKTVKKWKERDFQNDVSSRPHRINYALSDFQQTIITSVRQATWITVDDLVGILKPLIPEIGHSNCARTLVRHNINKLPKEEREKKKFKDYPPGYLHIDVTYLPKLNGIKKYLFVAIDRATRFVHVKIMDNRNKVCSVNFLKECLEYYPIKINKILTDNGYEFTLDEFKRHPNGRKPDEHIFTKTCKNNGIEHRRTKVKHPWTNGMVERFNKTIKRATVESFRYDNYDQMNESIKRYEYIYNFTRKHTAINRRTPYQTMLEWYQKDKSIFRFDPKLLLKYSLNGTTL